MTTCLVKKLFCDEFFCVETLRDNLFRRELFHDELFQDKLCHTTVLSYKLLQEDLFLMICCVNIVPR